MHDEAYIDLNGLPEKFLVSILDVMHLPGIELDLLKPPFDSNLRKFRMGENPYFKGGCVIHPDSTIFSLMHSLGEEHSIFSSLHKFLMSSVCDINAPEYMFVSDDKMLVSVFFSGHWAFAAFSNSLGPHSNTYTIGVGAHKYTDVHANQDYFLSKMRMQDENALWSCVCVPERNELFTQTSPKMYLSKAVVFEISDRLVQKNWSRTHLLNTSASQ